MVGSLSRRKEGLLRSTCWAGALFGPERRQQQQQCMRFVCFRVFELLRSCAVSKRLRFSCFLGWLRSCAASKRRGAGCVAFIYGGFSCLPRVEAFLSLLV